MYVCASQIFKSHIRRLQDHVGRWNFAWKQYEPLRYEDNLKIEDNLKNEDELKNEEELKNKDDLKNEDNLKKEADLKIKTVPGPSLHHPSCACQDIVISLKAI